MNKTKIDIISGFLGAGKTSLIKKLLLEELNAEKIVIIENEFGEIGIDGSMLKSTGVQVREISSGCICCTVSGDFSKALKEIKKDYEPDRVIIEPSGVGKLSEIINVIKDKSILAEFRLNMVLTVVDLGKYEIYLRNFREFFSDQLEYSEIIILSRTQNFSEAKTMEVVERITEEFSDKIIVSTAWDQLTAKRIIEVGEKRNVDLEEALNAEACDCTSHHDKCSHEHADSEIEDCGCDHNHGCGCDHHDISGVNNIADDVFTTWNLKTHHSFSKSFLQEILELSEKDESKFGKVLRAKGIIKDQTGDWMQFSYVPKELSFSEVSADIVGRICFIGVDLKADVLDNLFKGINNDSKD